MKMNRIAWLAAAVLICNLAVAQAPATTKKHLLVLGEEKGYRHESVSHAMAVIEQLGEKTGLWDTTIRTDTEPLTKKKLEFNAKNLNDFDAILMFTGGDLEMDAQQRADFVSFIHDDGKGLIGVHSAAISMSIPGRPSMRPLSSKTLDFLACSNGRTSSRSTTRFTR